MRQDDDGQFDDGGLADAGVAEMDDAADDTRDGRSRGAEPVAAVCRATCGTDFWRPRRMSCGASCVIRSMATAAGWRHSNGASIATSRRWCSSTTAARAKQLGFSRYLLRGVKIEIGVQVQKDGFRGKSQWSLPEKTDEPGRPVDGTEEIEQE